MKLAEEMHSYNIEIMGSSFDTNQIIGLSSRANHIHDIIRPIK